MGDLNDILTTMEKGGGIPRTKQSPMSFRSFVADCGLLDLGFVGYPFTWRNCKMDGHTQERLDRGLGSGLWLQMYPDVKITHHMIPGSHHALLHLQIVTLLRGNRFPETMVGQEKVARLEKTRMEKLESLRVCSGVVRHVVGLEWADSRGRILESGVRWRVGNGEKIQVSCDRWVPIPWSFKTTTRHPNLSRMVHELIDHVPLETRGDQ
ncbi:PREDICTED: reverse mRNAase [Prunus dulcis]|uniref:PREDICTED: reverse mRNAase n=1 Tax=Prunus dulcis TaxID=3755 RepID=A0A5E4FRV5_PRUDU|nr:PREDICTED: reverse mRNAase [Prunus dulcis]